MVLYSSAVGQNYIKWACPAISRQFWVRLILYYVLLLYRNCCWVTVQYKTFTFTSIFCTVIALQNAVPSQSDTHQTHQTTPAHMVIEKKRGGEEGVDRDDVEGKRAGNLGSDPGMPQREEQRGCDPHAAHSPSAPQGVAHQDQVKTLSPSLKAGTGVLPQRSTPKTSRSKQPRQTHQRGRKPAPTTRNPQATRPNTS